jgi:thiamine transporter
MNFNTKRLTTTAMMLAVATVLALVCAYIPFLNLPFGGGFTIASMLPLVIISYMYGVKWGLFSGFVYSIIQLLLGHSTVMALFTPGTDDFQGIGAAILICLIDYVLAYTALGLGGIFRDRAKSKARALVLGVILALGIRYLCHVISGCIFYGIWAEWFFSQEGFPLGAQILNTFSGFGLSLFYSIVYNGLFMLPEILITAVAAIPAARIRYIKKESRG